MSFVLSRPAECCRPAKANFFVRFMAARAMRRSRQQLSELDDKSLRDIGLTREEAMKEVHRSDWDAAPHWERPFL